CAARSPIDSRQSASLRFRTGTTPSHPIGPPMKVLFIEEYLPQEMLGIMWLSRAIKDAGHERRCLFLPDRNGLETLKAYSPDVVCYSITTGMHLYFADVNRKVKQVLPEV